MSALMTAEEFFAWCHRKENADKNYELIRGEVPEFPLAGTKHGATCANAARIFGNYVHQYKRGHACCGTGIIWERNPDTVIGPDVSYFTKIVRYEDLSPGYSDRKPVLVIDVLSPKDHLSRFAQRLQWFLRWGVLLIWVLDSEEGTVTVYRPAGPPEALKVDEELTGSDILPDFRCRVADFFRLPGETSA